MAALDALGARVQADTMIQPGWQEQLANGLRWINGAGAKGLGAQIAGTFEDTG